jgi:hypothetical protein
MCWHCRSVHWCGFGAEVWAPWVQRKQVWDIDRIRVQAGSPCSQAATALYGRVLGSGMYMTLTLVR